MQPRSRHQCLVYEGAPSRHLPTVAAAARDNLRRNYRCLYLNSPPMVAGMGSYLAAIGIDVTQEIVRTSLILTSDRQHIVDDRFDVDRMIRTLEQTLEQSLRDGYAGLWATGDMSWEMGPRQDFSKLLEYEWRLEQFFREHPQLGGICQYHANTIPPESLRHGFLAHPSIFVNETLSVLNPHYLSAESFTEAAALNPELDSAIRHLCHPNSAC
jgi:hypothetical protein